jgi:hypothetical protein
VLKVRIHKTIIISYEAGLDIRLELRGTLYEDGGDCARGCSCSSGGLNGVLEISPVDTGAMAESNSGLPMGSTPCDGCDPSLRSNTSAGWVEGSGPRFSGRFRTTTNDLSGTGGDTGAGCMSLSLFLRLLILHRVSCFLPEDSLLCRSSSSSSSSEELSTADDPPRPNHRLLFPFDVDADLDCEITPISSGMSSACRGGMSLDGGRGSPVLEGDLLLNDLLGDFPDDPGRWPWFW